MSYQHWAAVGMIFVATSRALAQTPLGAHEEKPMPAPAWQRLQPFVDKVIPAGIDSGLNALTIKDQTLFLVWTLTAELDNGGFAQFFFNSSGEHALITTTALKRIGATSVARLLNDAIGLFPGGVVPVDNDARNEALSALPDTADERFQELDDQFQEIGSQIVLEQLARYYLDI